MRGEFIGVWSETWREIWLPLIDENDVPQDIFCELFRAITPALKDPAGGDPLIDAVNDDVQFRKAFERAVALSGSDIPLREVRDAFDTSRAIEFQGAPRRRTAAEAAFAFLTGDKRRGATLLSQALSEIAVDPKERAFAGVINDPAKSREVFEALKASDLVGERAVVAFLEKVYDVLEDLGGDGLSNRYFNLLTSFIEKFSLRYDLRRPCTLCPTLTGMFASVVRNLNQLGLADQNVARRFKDVQEAVQDLRLGQTEGRISSCVAKQIMLLEAIGATAAGVTGTELAAICNEVKEWPHPALKSALLSLYGFTSDFPGLRHGTPSKGMIREINMRDLLAVSILLAGFTPYLSDQFDADAVYRGT